ncbi:CoA transferase subunit A [Evansella sp. AB-P1]|uniref:CoA transferase subunit A n=1 Tax=Evansella sp. AB-P1 TaxID=3037653 RepID=UPI00241ED52F|nr:CoA transferase subunit A [Evansella sp. AB-P1]MDG5787517.1 CoA transferase subunit A [Evansella sp. AB-P1]
MTNENKDNLSKVISIEEAGKKIVDGSTIMIGGFGGVGNPPSIIQQIIVNGTNELTVICNDAGFPNIGVGQLVTNKSVRKLIASHIGSNPKAGEQMTEGTLEVVFSPQGTLAERIRAGGVGLGGVLIDIGIGNPKIDGNKEKVTVGDSQYMIETALTADISLVYAKKGDEFGNLIYDTSARNTNPLVAMAGMITIAEVEEIVSVGDLHPEEVVTPGAFVDYIVKSEGVNWSWAWEKM